MWWRGEGGGRGLHRGKGKKRRGKPVVGRKSETRVGGGSIGPADPEFDGVASPPLVWGLNAGGGQRRPARFVTGAWAVSAGDDDPSGSLPRRLNSVNSGSKRAPLRVPSRVADFGGSLEGEGGGVAYQIPAGSERGAVIRSERMLVRQDRQDRQTRARGVGSIHGQARASLYTTAAGIRVMQGLRNCPIAAILVVATSRDVIPLVFVFPSPGFAGAYTGGCAAIGYDLLTATRKYPTKIPLPARSQTRDPALSPVGGSGSCTVTNDGSCTGAGGKQGYRY